MRRKHARMDAYSPERAAEACASWNRAYGRTVGPHAPADRKVKNDAKGAAGKRSASSVILFAGR
jgi:hypothetical protein